LFSQGNKVVLTCFKNVLFQHLFERIEKAHGKPQFEYRSPGRGLKRVLWNAKRTAKNYTPTLGGVNVSLLSNFKIIFQLHREFLSMPPTLQHIRKES
jgi:hypothetical protein